MIKADPNDPKGIVWLASYPKSGNTWLRMFLYQLMRIMGGHPREEDELNKLDRSSGYEAKLFGLFQQFLGKPLGEASRLETMSVRALVHTTVADRFKGVALLKTHNLFGELGEMPTVNVAASVGAIYVVRDPRDIAASLSKHLGSTIDEAIQVMKTPAFATQNSAETAFEIWGTWSDHVSSWTSDANEQTLIVRYEDMMTKPTETFTKIVEHLGQTPTGEQITEAIELSSFDKLQRQEEAYSFRERSPRADRFFASGKSGLWREKLSAAQANEIAVDHREQMARFGYLD